MASKNDPVSVDLLDDRLLQLSHRHPIVIFDGYCNLCNTFVRHLITIDRKLLIRFATLDTDVGRQLRTQTGGTDSVILLDRGALLTRSAVALAIYRHLGYPWKVLSWFAWMPLQWRDAIYDFIAARRYQWFGRRDQCMLPGPEIRDRFLQE